MISVWSANAHPGAAYYLLPSRAWELMLGAALALLRPSRRGTVSPVATDAALLIGFCLISIPVFVYDARTPFPGIAALVPCIGSALVIWFGGGPGRVGRLLENRPMVFVGKLSYSLYLWHWPVIVFAAMLRPHPLSLRLSGRQTLALLAVTFVCASLSYVLIEDPIRRRTLLPTRRQLLTTLSASAALLALLGATAIAARGLPYRLPAPALRIAEALNDHAGWQRCENRFVRDTAAEDLCRIGPESGAPARFLLWGDSHALALLPALDAAAKEVDVAGLLVSLDGCPPVPGIDRGRRSGIDCSKFNRRVSHLIDSERIDAVILAAYWTGYLRPNLQLTDGFAEGTSSEYFLAQLKHSIDRISSQGVAVFIVDDVPITKNYAPAKFARALWWGRGIGEARVPLEQYAARLQPILNALAGSRFARITLAKYLCPDGKSCPAILDGRSNYFDDNHLTEHASRRLAPAFLDALRRVRPPTDTPPRLSLRPQPSAPKPVATNGPLDGDPLPSGPGTS